MKALIITVSGKVQGVWFRASTKNKADELELKGAVRNLSDGSVSIEVEGPTISLDEFVKWCKVGPEAATVIDVAIEDTTIKNYKEFKIIRQ